jgi:hypothetical protein
MDEVLALHFGNAAYFGVHRLFVDTYCLQHPDRYCVPSSRWRRTWLTCAGRSSAEAVAPSPAKASGAGWNGIRTSPSRLFPRSADR